MVVLTVDQIIEHSGFGLSQKIFIAASSWIFFLELLSLVSDGILLPILKCEWALSSAGTTLYLLSTRLAFCLGGAVGGKFGDQVGRRVSIVCGLLLQITMTTIALNCYSLHWYVLFHTLNKVAFGLILPPAHTYAIESCPAAYRFLVKVVFGFAGCFGALTGAIAGQYYEIYGWRRVQLLVTLPCYIAFIVFYNLDSSPRHLLVKGKTEQAESIIKKILRRNGKTILEKFELKPELQITETPGTYSDLLRPGLRKHSLKLIFIVMCKGVFMTTIYIAMPYLLSKTKDLQSSQNTENCYLLTSKAKSNIVISALPDLLVNPSLLLFSQFYGRRVAIFTALLCTSCAFFCTNFFSLGSPEFSFIIGVATGTTSAARSVIVLYTAELYPTTLRGVAIGMIWAADSSGSFASPFLAEYVIMYAPRVFVLAAAVAIGGAAVLARYLDIETLNKPLVESIADLPARKQLVS